VFDLVDHLTSNLMLPVGGIALSVFAGFVVPKRLLAEELRLGEMAAALLRVLLRYVVPAAIAAVTLGPFLGLS
jgi:NSS family neurotransmitter:Na+ symporter